MSTPFLTSKLNRPPIRLDLVQRSRLVEQLEAGSHARLLLIAAPAGFGKTTLAVAWLQKVESPAAWLALDESDNDPVRFLGYFIAAVSRVAGDAGAATQALLKEPQPPSPERIMTTLINEISEIPQDFILVLDDYHVIHSLEIHHMLAFLVENQPPNMQFVLISREDPPLPLPRLRVRNQVVVIRQKDLRFSTKETAAFLNTSMGLDLLPEDISALEHRTEGWIAGLQLAALSMKGRENVRDFIQEFSGSNRYVLDYLIEEVLNQQSGEIQDFLLKTSILDRLSGDLCDAVMGMAGSQALLESLEQANLFITALDQSRSWYRYHRLFRELLQNRLRSQDAASETGLHLRASRWYEAEGLISDAISHALSASDWQRGANLVHIASDRMLKNGQIFTLLSWYSQIPKKTLISDPEFCLDYSWPLILSGKFDEAAFYLSQAEENAPGDPAFLGQILTARAYLVRVQGDHARMIELSQKALSLLPKLDVDSRCIVTTNLGIAYWHSGHMKQAEEVLAEAQATAQQTDNEYVYRTVQVFRGLVQAVRGQLRKAESYFQGAAEQDRPAFSAGLANLYLCALNYEWNHLEESTAYLLKAIDIGEQIQNDELLVSCAMLMAQLYTASGNIAAAKQVLGEAQQKVRVGKVPAPAKGRLAAVQVQVALGEMDLAAADDWAHQLQPGADSHSFCRFLNLTQAKLLLAQNRREDARAYLEECYEKASGSDWRYGQILIRALQSLAAFNLEDASGYLLDAFTLVGSEKFIRTFVDQGDALHPVLRACAGVDTPHPHLGEILQTIQQGPGKFLIAQAKLVEPLSDRELEVLACLKKGLTNPEIAEALIITTGTVKTHVHHICGKLGVRNRTEAVSRANELGL